MVYTNKIFGTAYRGFGHLEVLWGIERNMDLVARALGLDPVEFRRKNLLRVGETTITGELFTDGHGRPEECLRLVAEAIGWDPKARAAEPVAPGSGKVRGEGRGDAAQGAGHADLHLVLGRPSCSTATARRTCW